MAADPRDDPESDEYDPLVQVNIRIRRSLKDRVDTRRQLKGLSRDVWGANAWQWALDYQQQRTLRTARTRTAPSVARRT